MAKCIYIILIVSALFLGMLSAAPGYAASTTTVDPSSIGARFCATSGKKGMQYCNCIMDSSPGTFVRPLVECFVSADTGSADAIPAGVIPYATTSFLNAAKSYYLPIAVALITISIIFFGIQLMTGNVQKLKAETFTLLFKIAFILYFLDQAPAFYADMVRILQELGGMISNASTSLNNNGFCNNSTNGVPSGFLWDRWDCIFGFIFISTGVGTAIFMSATLLFTGPLAIIILFISLYLSVAIFFTVARFIHIYLMAVLGLSFMFCLGYLFVPLLLFKHTAKEYFTVWINMLLGYLLTPVIMLGYMGMMLVAADIALFSGDFSIWHEVGGASAGVNATAPSTSDPKVRACQTSVQQTSPGNIFALAGCSVKEGFIHLFYIDYGNLASQLVGGGSDSTANAGMLGNVKNFALSYVPTVRSDVGFSVDMIDLDSLGSAIGKSPGQYLSDIAVSVSVAALLAYIMFSMLTYIPTLAGELVSQGKESVGRSLAKSEVFAEAATYAVLDTIKNMTVEAAKGAVKGVAQGGAAGAAKGAAVGAAKGAAQSAAQIALKKR